MSRSYTARYYTNCCNVVRLGCNLEQAQYPDRVYIIATNTKHRILCEYFSPSGQKLFQSCIVWVLFFFLKLCGGRNFSKKSDSSSKHQATLQYIHISKMSRFWAGGSSSESENESGSESEEEVQNQKVVGGKFMAYDSDSG